MRLLKTINTLEYDNWKELNMENAGIVSHCSAGGAESDFLQDGSNKCTERTAGKCGTSGGGSNSLSKMERRQINRLNVQLLLSVVVVLAGLTLVFIGLYIEPKGEIHNSVIIVFGEALTFAGALIGIDYSYRLGTFKRTREDRKADKEDE